MATPILCNLQMAKAPHRRIFWVFCVFSFSIKPCPVALKVFPYGNLHLPIAIAAVAISKTTGFFPGEARQKLGFAKKGFTGPSRCNCGHIGRASPAGFSDTIASPQAKTAIWCTWVMPSTPMPLLW